MSEDNTGDAQQSQFTIEKIYIKDSSFESPRAPAVFQEEWNPEIAVDLQTRTEEMQDGVYDVVLTVTVNAKSGDDNIFLIELQQGGIVTLSGFEQEQQAQLLGAYVPGVLFPYAREAISRMIAQGGFPQLLLQPVNFDALYQQQLEQAAAQKQTTHGTVGNA